MQIDNAKDCDVAILINNLIEYSDNYSKTSGSLWQYYKNELALTNAGTIDDFPGNSALFEFMLMVQMMYKWWCHWNN